MAIFVLLRARGSRHGVMHPNGSEKVFLGANKAKDKHGIYYIFRLFNIGRCYVLHKNYSIDFVIIF